MLPLLGKVVPQPIFRPKHAQIRVRQTLHSQSQIVGALPTLNSMGGSTPTTSGYASG